MAEVAEELQVETDDVAQAMIATQNFAPVSLDAPAPGSEVPVGDLIVDENDDYARVEVMGQLRPAIAGLSARDRMILHMRFIDACTQSEIGTALGISQMQVSRRLTSILHQLRGHLQEARAGRRRGGVPRLSAGPAPGAPAARSTGSLVRGRSLRDGAVQPVQQLLQRLLELRVGMVLREQPLQPLHVWEGLQVQVGVGVGDVRVPLVERLLRRRGLGAERGRSSSRCPSRKLEKDR